MRALTFTVWGEPVGKARARVVRAKRTGKPRAFTPKKTVSYESRVKQLAWLAMQERGFKAIDTGPVALGIKAFFETAGELSLREPGDVSDRYTKRPDWDNVGKVVSDALTGVVYRDDAQVASATVEKFVGSCRLVVTVESPEWEVGR